MVHWTTHLEGGPRRVNHAAAAVGHLIYSMGGFCTGDDYDTERPIDVCILNTVTNRWKRLPLPLSSSQRSCIPYLRFGHTAVAYGEIIYIWGGRNNRNASNTLYAFNTVTHEWTKPNVTGYTPGARDGHTACIIGKFMYIFGGFEADVEHYSQDVFELDLELMIWRSVNTRGEQPHHRDFHTATAIGTRMYVFGGRGDESGLVHTMNEVYCSQIMYLDTADMVWYKPEMRGAVPTGRRSHSAFFYNKRIYIFGGYNGILDAHFGDLHCFNPENNEWMEVMPNGKGPCKRRRQACILVDSKVFLFGGTSPAGDDVALPNVPHSDEELDFNLDDLIDHSDLHILDFDPTLLTLTALVILDTHHVDRLPQWLPRSVLNQITYMVKNNEVTPV